MRSFPSKDIHMCLADYVGSLNTGLDEVYPHGVWTATKISEIKKHGVRGAFHAQACSHVGACRIGLSARMVGNASGKAPRLVMSSQKQWSPTNCLSACAVVVPACTVMIVTHHTANWK